MASAIIHLCVAKEVNKYLNMDEKLLLLGSIAPDISKEIGETKEISHFLDHSNEDDIPNIDAFLLKYKSELNNTFELGYFIHLMTDKYWFKNYIYNYIERYTDNNVKVKITYNALRELIYNDYTNINSDLIDEYDINLNMFKKISSPRSKISEIPVDKLSIIIEKMKLIMIESKNDKNFIFDTNDIKEFINQTVKYIIKDIQMLGISPKSN